MSFCKEENKYFDNISKKVKSMIKSGVRVLNVMKIYSRKNLYSIHIKKLREGEFIILCNSIILLQSALLSKGLSILSMTIHTRSNERK